jgi:drug/metabolite transporter (DMT)-like permease
VTYIINQIFWQSQDFWENCGGLLKKAASRTKLQLHMNKDRATKFPPVMYVVIGVSLWSLGGVFFKLTSVTGFEANLGRCLFAAVTVFFLTRHLGLKFDRWVLLNSLFYTGALSFFALANKKTTAANAIFIQYTAPVYVLLLAPFILKEKFKWTDLITVLVCLGGLSLFFIDQGVIGDLSPESQFEGNILALFSGVCFGVYMLLLRHPQMLKHNPAVSVFYGNLMAILFMLPFVISAPSAWTGKDLLAVAILGIFQIGLAYYFFTLGVAKGVRSLDASIIGFIEPILNPVWVFLAVGERPGSWALLGGAVIVAAVIIHTLSQSRSAPFEPVT